MICSVTAHRSTPASASLLDDDETLQRRTTLTLPRMASALHNCPQASSQGRAAVALADVRPGCQDFDVTEEIAPAAQEFRPLIPEHRQAEHVAASIMQQLRVKGAHTTPGSRDGGIDVEARRAIAQVKWTSAQVGRADLQRLCGADRGAKGRNRRLVFFAKTGYSPEAIRYADEAKIFLFTFTLKGKVEARNERARRLLKGDTRKFRVRDFSKYTEDRTLRGKNTPVTAVDVAVFAVAVLALVAMLVGGAYLLIQGVGGLSDPTLSAFLTSACGLVLVLVAGFAGWAIWRLGSES